MEKYSASVALLKIGGGPNDVGWGGGGTSPCPHQSREWSGEAAWTRRKDVHTCLYWMRGVRAEVDNTG
jgi:hypothetical protein